MEWRRIEEKWLEMTVRLQGAEGASSKSGQSKSAQTNANPAKSPSGGKKTDSELSSDHSAMGNVGANSIRALA